MSIFSFWVFVFLSLIGMEYLVFVNLTAMSPYPKKGGFCIFKWKYTITTSAQFVLVLQNELTL